MGGGEFKKCKKVWFVSVQISPEAGWGGGGARDELHFPSVSWKHAGGEMDPHDQSRTDKREVVSLELEHKAVDTLQFYFIFKEDKKDNNHISISRKREKEKLQLVCWTTLPPS